jgi:hypothetical protein
MGQLFFKPFFFFKSQTGKKSKKKAEFRVLPPVADFRTLIRDDMDSFRAEDPVMMNRLNFDPPEDCSLASVQPIDLDVAASTPGQSKEVDATPTVKIHEPESDPLKAGNLYDDPQALLLGLYCFFDEEITTYLSQCSYSTDQPIPEGRPSVKLMLRLTDARLSASRKKRLIVAAWILYPYLSSALRDRFEEALIRLVEVVEMHNELAEGEALDDMDRENINSLVSAIERAPNRYWQLLTTLKTIHATIQEMQRTMGAHVMQN